MYEIDARKSKIIAMTLTCVKLFRVHSSLRAPTAPLDGNTLSSKSLITFLLQRIKHFVLGMYTDREGKGELIDIVRTFWVR